MVWANHVLSRAKWIANAGSMYLLTTLEVRRGRIHPRDVYGVIYNALSPEMTLNRLSDAVLNWYGDGSSRLSADSTTLLDYGQFGLSNTGGVNLPGAKLNRPVGFYSLQYIYFIVSYLHSPEAEYSSSYRV